MELRILSHPGLRKRSDIVKLLGLCWDCSKPSTPEPVMVLEYAEFNLKEFQKRYPALPSSTKRRLALEVATGIDALHAHGIIHSDIKLENILVFTDNEAHAKIADFGHSILDTGEERTLLGGTERYAAPEWKARATTNILRLTDVYSYGLVFVSIIAGFDVLEKLFEQLLNHPGEESTRQQQWQRLKKSDELKDVLIRALASDNASGTGRSGIQDMSDDPYLIMRVLHCTVRAEVQSRCLQEAIQHLAGTCILGDDETRLPSGIDNFCIPYQALEPVSNVVKDQILRALVHVANTPADTRRPAVSHELSVCYASSFGTTSSEQVAPFAANMDLSLAAMIEAALQGNSRSRLLLSKLFRAHGRELPVGLPVRQWLADAVRTGSFSALEQLKETDPVAHREYLHLYRVQFCGNSRKLFDDLEYTIANLPPLNEALNERGDTILHYAASTSHMGVLQALQNPETYDYRADWNVPNAQGDTPLICAMRAGHHEVVYFLLGLGVDASATNDMGETALHFIVSLDEDQMSTVGAMLLASGADPFAEARGSTQVHDIKFTTGGDAALRAVTMDFPKALEVLLDLHEHAQSLMAAHYRQLYYNISIPRLFGYAVKLHHVRALGVLLRKSPSMIIPQFDRLAFWDNGQLLSLPALCLAGGVSPNPEYGLDLPEKFWRILSCEAGHTTVLYEMLHLLLAHGADFLSRPCGIYRNALAMAVGQGRYDGVVWVLSHSNIDFIGGTEIAASKFWHRGGGEADDQQSTGTGLREGPEWSSTSVRDGRSSSRALPNNRSQFNTPINIANTNNTNSQGVLSHRDKWPLIELVDLAITTDQREILDLLVRCRAGLALGRNEQLEITLFRSNRREKSSRAQVLASYSASDAILHFPPSAQGYVAMFGQPSKWLYWSNRYKRYKFTTLAGTLNYALLYMNSIAESRSRDILLARIVLEAQAQLFAQDPIQWSPQHNFEAQCLLPATGVQILAPLAHAVNAQWQGLVRLLLRNGASPQDTYWSFSGESDARSWSSQTVMSSLVGHDSVGDDDLVSLLTMAAEHSGAYIIGLQDLERLVWRRVKPAPVPGDGGFGVYPVKWVDGKLHSLVADNWSTPEQEDLWQAVVRADRAQGKRLHASGKQSHTLLHAVLVQKYFAVQALLEIGFEPDGDSQFIREREHPAPLSSLPNFWSERPWQDSSHSFYITPLDVAYWTSLVHPEACTREGLQLKKTNARIETLLRQYGAARGKEYSVLFQIFVAPLSPLVSVLASRKPFTNVVKLVFLLVGLAIVTMSVVYFSLVSWRILQECADEIGSPWSATKLWYAFLLIHIFSHGFSLFIGPSLLAATFEDAHRVPPLTVAGVILGLSLCHLGVGGYLFLAIRFKCGSYAFMELAASFLSNFVLSCDVLLFGHLMIFSLERACRIRRLSLAVHGGNQTVAWAAMYGPGKSHIDRLVAAICRAWSLSSGMTATRLSPRVVPALLGLLRLSSEPVSDQLPLLRLENESRSVQEMHRVRDGEDDRHYSNGESEHLQIADRHQTVRRGRAMGVGLTMARYLRKYASAFAAYPVELAMRIKARRGEQSQREWIRTRNAELVGWSGEAESTGLLE